MKVTIMYSNSYDGGDGWTYYPMLVEISNNCPVCNKKRGKPYFNNYYQDGESVCLNNWENKCGHIDLYENVYKEHKKLEAEKKKTIFKN